MGILRSGGKCSDKRWSKSRSLVLLALALLPGLGAAPVPDPTGPVALENQRAGTPGWELQNPALGHEIEGYSDQTSVLPGETVRLHISSASPRVTVQVYRMGWYGGAGARQVLEFRGMTGGPRPIPQAPAEGGLSGCCWAVSCRGPAGPGWGAGVLRARLPGS